MAPPDSDVAVTSRWNPHEGQELQSRRSRDGTQSWRPPSAEGSDGGKPGCETPLGAQKMLKLLVEYVSLPVAMVTMSEFIPTLVHVVKGAHTGHVPKWIAFRHVNMCDMSVFEQCSCGSRSSSVGASGAYAHVT